MRLVVLPEASEDIDRLYEFLKDENPRSAQKAMLAIDEGFEMLIASPYLGVRMHGREMYRQLFVPFGKNAYALRYRINSDNDALVVVRIWHSRENRSEQ